jgi:hypothetical protein
VWGGASTDPGTGRRALFVVVLFAGALPYLHRKWERLRQLARLPFFRGFKRLDRARLIEMQYGVELFRLCRSKAIHSLDGGQCEIRSLAYWTMMTIDDISAIPVTVAQARTQDVPISAPGTP